MTTSAKKTNEFNVFQFECMLNSRDIDQRTLIDLVICVVHHVKHFTRRDNDSDVFDV